MKFNRTLRKTGGIACIAAMLMQIGIGVPQARATDQIWNAGSSLDFLWSTIANWSAGGPGSGDNVFFNRPIPNPGLLLNPSIITLGSGSVANSLTIKDNYTLTGGDLTLTTGGIGTDMGMTAVIGSKLSGTVGLTKTGGGALRLTNPGNDYTGTTTISNGSLIISDAGALGASSSAIVVTGFNPNGGQLTNLRGFGGGSLVLDGTTAGFTLGRDLSLQGQGPISDRSAAVISVGDNTLSGTITTAQPSNGTNINTRITSAAGNLTLSGTLNVLGAAGTTITTLGGATQQAGAGAYTLTGALTGTGTLEKTGSGTLFLTPSATSGFSGTLRLSSSAASGQSSVRITSAGVLGTRVTTGTGSVLDMNGGLLEVRMDTPSLLAGGAAALVYGRTSSTFFADHSPGGNAVNGTDTFGAFAYEDGQTFTLNSRNGYGITYAATPVVGGNGNTNFTNNLAGTLTFTGAFWSNADNTGNRNMTFAGNGNTLITGAITASAAAFDHTLSKTGSGILTINNNASTLDGAVSVQGSMAIQDFRSIGAAANATTITLGSTSTVSGNLIIGTSTAPTAANLATSRPIALTTTTASNAIYASQSGGTGVTLNGAITMPNTTTASLILGGTSTASNTVAVAIPAGGGASPTNGLIKQGGGTWVLSAANAYPGATTITAGTLKLNANAAASTIIGEATGNTVVFNTDAATQTAGGSLEFTGISGSATTEALGALTPTVGAGTVKIISGGGGAAANLTFTSLGTTARASGINFDTASGGGGTVTLTGVATTTATTLPGNGHLYINSNNFAVSTAGVIGAPTYTVGGAIFNDAGGANVLVASRHNQLSSVLAAAPAAISLTSLRIGANLTMANNANLTVNTGAVANDGGILAYTGNPTITTSGTGGITTGGGGTLVYQVVSGQTLTLAAPMLVGTTGGFTKNGAGTLLLSVANAQTGATTINEGIVRLSGSGTLSGGSDLAIRQNGSLELNGINSGTTIRALNGSGTINNGSSGATTTLTVGNNNGTGTFTGVIGNGTGGGTINVTKVGTGAQSWLGLNTYTGVTTIGSTGLVTVNVLADGGPSNPSGIGASSNAASNLVFNGSTGGLVYQGALVNGSISTGATSASTDRLFTLSGTGATLSSTAANNNAVVFSSTGDIAFGVVGPQLLTLTGTSQGDNTLNPRIQDSGTSPNITSVTKTGTGIWKLGGGLTGNTYSGATLVQQGILIATNGQGLSSNSNLQFDGGTLYSQGNFTRNIGTAAGEMQFVAPAANTAQFSGGFLGGDSKLTVNWSGTPTWGGGAGFIDTRDGLMLNGSQARAQGATGSIALSEVDLASAFSLGTASGTGKAISVSTTANSANVTVTTGDTSGLIVGQTLVGPGFASGAYITSINSATTFTMSANTPAAQTAAAGHTVEANALRAIRVDDNGNTGADFATISGAITGNAGTGIRKLGTGILKLSGANLYDGETNINQGTLQVTSLGLSTAPGLATSVGTSTNANANSNAITIGNGGAGGAILQYVGPGETSDRKIRFSSTTGGPQIHADGSGPLILTNVANDFVTPTGAKTLSLRGTNTAGNMITSALTNDGGGGVLSVTVDGGATWILTSASNSYTGTTTISAGALGVGDNAALGTSTVSLNNGSLFAYGADRTVANVVQHANGATTGFQGDYSLTFSQPLAILAGANSGGINNNVVSGKAVTFTGATANSLGANRGLLVDGTGDTVINGDITTSTAFGLAITKTGNGTLTLGGSASNNFNQNGANIDIDRGTVKLTASNNISSAATAGGILMTPEAALELDTATLNLNGTTQVINAFTANTGAAGTTTTIDNASASAASLTVGANNSAVAIGGGGGAYNITNSGGGALSITKTGTAAGTISTGVTLTYTGATSVDGGGSLTISSAVNGTSALNVTGASSLLALSGGITGPASVTSVSVGNGATLNLLDGAGNQLTNLGTLTLGAASGTNTTLGFNVGDSVTAGDNVNTDKLALTAAGILSLFAGNNVTFNLTDSGLNGSTNYVLLESLTGGGFLTGPLTLGNYVLGSTPGGFTSMTLANSTDNQIILTTGTLITGQSFWRGVGGGGTDLTWNANANNWSQDKVNSLVATTVPGAGTDVIFQINTGSNAAVSTTLEQNFKINSLTFEADGTPANTPTSITIAPGTIATNRLEVAPQVPTDGVKITTGGSPLVTISAPFRLGASQTWNVADATSTLVLSGGLQGAADVNKTGSGKVTLSGPALSTFNTGLTTDITVSGGNLELTNSGALGTVGNANLARVDVAGGGFYYNNATAGTVANPLTLSGGALSAGSAGQTYSGTVNVSGASTVNMADSNGAPTATARSITLSGVVSGSGGLTINSNNTAATGNQVGGTLTLSNAGNTWNGPVTIERGTLTLGANASPAFTANDVLFNGFGRAILQGTNGTTLSRTGTLNYSAGAVGEFQVDNTSGALAANYTVTQGGTVSLGAGGTGATVRVVLADAASALDISNSVTLGGTSSISVAGGDADSFVTISGAIGDGGSGYGLTINDDAGAWAQTNTILRLTGANTFTGTLTLSEGTLEFDTASNIGGAASSLGQGTGITTGTGTLKFIGASSQTTDRPVTQNGATVFSANGTGGASISYTGAISAGANNFTLTGATGSAGNISGGITQTGIAVDATVSGGTWTLSGTASTVADDLTILGAGAVLNLNAADVLLFGASADSTLQIQNGGVVNLGASQTATTAMDRLFVGQATTGATAVLGMSTFNMTTARFDLGERTVGLEGSVTGTGTLTVTADYNLYRGTINANLAGAGPVEKFGPGTVTLGGNNGGLTSATAVRFDEGLVILDYNNDNGTKFLSTTGLDFRGGNLTSNGNNSAATSQTVGALVLTQGHGTIDVNGGTGQESVLNFGAITRTASQGTIRLELPSGTQSATNGITTTQALAANGTLGGYVTVNDGTSVNFATKSGNNIVGITPSVKNNVSTWANGDQISNDTTGFTGTASTVGINSLRFNAAGGSSVTLGTTAALNIANGGILITSAVTSGAPSILNGTLATGVTEVIVTNDSTQSFEIGADVRINNAFSKSGTGTVKLSGNNAYTGTTQIIAGTLQASGGTAIGDTSLVNLATNQASTLQLLNNETIGRLSGGNAATNQIFGTVAIGTNTLTINNSGVNTTYAGLITGTGSLVRQGTHNLALSGISTGFTGSVVVNNGLFQLTGLGQINASSFTINKGGNLLIDNNSTTRSGTRILDTASITLNSADGTFNGATLPRGLGIRTDQNATTNETIGVLNVTSGANYITGEASGTTGRAAILFENIVRTAGNNSTLDIRARNLGLAAGDRNNIAFNATSFAANETAFIGTLVGGGGAAGTQNISIVPWAIGEGPTANPLDTNMGNSLLTYVATNGFRPLDFATEYDTIALAAATDNARESLTADLTGLAGTTVNSLVLNNNAVAATTVNVTGSGAGQTLAVTSGAMLFTLNNAAVVGNYAMNLGGFDSGITTAGASPEYVIHVVNPSSANAAIALNSTISSPLTSTADITKSGRGTLILSGINTAGGGTKKTTINEGTLEIADLDNIGGNTGALNFAGGTLRLGATLTDDITLRTITFRNGGGTIDTNGLSPTFAGSIGTGSGGFTKAGLGNLTLNAAATYTGATLINAGTLTVGANNALGNGGDLTVAGGATLALGTNSITAGLVTTSGASPLITGTGTITASSSGFAFNHTGDTTIDALLAGAGGVLKTQANVVTLTGASTYSGITEVQAGTLSFNSIGNVGGGASALGNPSTAENGIIRMGLTSTATALTYTGGGHSTDRVIGLQSTTGGVTINGNGTGALALGTIQTETAGAKTLTLGGTSLPAVINSTGAILESVATLSVTKSGTNTWAINGASTYTGATSAGAGVLRAGNNQAFGTVGTVTLVNTDSVLELANGVNVANSLSISNTGNNKVLRLLSGATTGTYSGGIAIAETTAGNFDINADTGGTFTISGIISGAVAGGVEKTGLGTVVLNNSSNSYTGLTTVSAGSLQSGANSVIPTTLTVNSNADGATATMDFNGFNNTLTGVALGGSTNINTVHRILTGAGTLTLGGNVTTVAGSTTSSAVIAGNLALGAATRTFTVADSTSTLVDLDVQAVVSGTAVGITKAGAGVLQLSNTNTYTGTTTISPTSGQSLGVIAATANDALGTGPVTAVFGSGALTGQIVLSGGITVGNSSFTTSGPGSDGTSSGIIRSLSGANTISGNINMTGGGGASTYRADTSASLTFNGNVGGVGGNTLRIVNLVGGGDFFFNGTIRNTNDASASTVGINSANTGTTTLNGTNTYTLATTVGAGSTLIAGSTQAFGVGSAATVDGTLRLAGFNNSLGSIAGAGTIENANAGNVTLTVGGDNTGTTFSGIIQDGAGAGTLALTKTGTGTMILSGTNTFTGRTVIGNGAISVGVVDATATADQPLGKNTALDLGVAATSAGTLIYTGAAGTLGKDVNILGSGSNTIQNSGTGLLTLSGTLDKTGTTLVLAGGASGITVTGVIIGASSGSDLVANGGVVTLANANTYNGPTFIRNGATLNATVTDALPIANGRSSVIMDDSGTGSSILSLGANQAIASLAGAATSSLALGSNTLTIGAASGTTTFDGVISGTGGGIIKDDASTLVLGGNNNFTGSVSINAGTVQVTHASGLGTTAGGTTVANGASLILSNVNVGNESITINGNGVGGLGALQATGTSTITAALNINTDSYIGVQNLADILFLQGNLTGSAGYTKIGAGTLVVSGAGSTYSGVTTVSTGTLVVTDPNALGGTGGGTVVAPGAILELDGGVSIGAEDIILQSTGSNSYATLRSAGGTNTWGGNISFTGGYGGLGAASGATLNLTGATINKTDVALFITGGGTVNINNVIGGDGDTGEFNDDLNVVGATVQLNALNTYTGPTNVYGGGTLRNGITDALPNSSIVGNAASTTLTLGNAADGAVTNTYDLNGYDQTVATLNTVITGTNSNFITNNSATTTSTLSVSAGDFAGIIQNGGSGQTVNLVKQGSGADVLTLKGANTYTGTTVVMNGTLQVGFNDVGTTGTGLTTVQTTGTIAGTGTILGNATISGVLKPGDAAGVSLGILDIAGDLTLNGTSTSYFQIGDPNLVFDQVHNTLGTGVLTLGGFIDLGTLFAGGYSPVNGDSWQLFANFGSIGGTFNAGTNYRQSGTGGGDLFLPTLTGIYKWDVSQFTTNGTIAIYVPEPSRALLLLVGMLGIFGRRRRRND